MSTEAIASPVVAQDVEGDGAGDGRKIDMPKPTGLHSPPDSNTAMVDGSDSELSDLDDMDADELKASILAHPLPKLEPKPEPEPEPEPEPAVEDDIGEILPDHFSGTVPVFKPTMKQFKDFKIFMGKIDSYGMRSGIVKVIPPQEWKDAQSELHDLVKQIRVRDPIKQEIMGSNGTYRQVNILHQRSYNLPQWRQLCDQSEHQPPARRGERRANADKPKPRPATRSRAPAPSSTPKSRPSRARKDRGARKSAQGTEGTAEPEDRPMTPVSPKPEDEAMDSVEQDPGVKEEDNEDGTPVPRRMGGIAKGKTQSTSARRKYIRREGSAMIDEAAFKDFDYHMDVSDYTPERCEELERTYWRTLTYAPPLYGADLPGTLFDESSEIWNLNKLPNLLDVLGTKVPGVNTAYLYLGMWKATFAWHLEDVDLYSINYLHFGAPKQWYSISQGDARRFEAAMKNIWPTEAKACDQFLRHKGFLISPAHLKQHYNITVNKCVSYPGEFVVTYPYGYHSGYNLGYNCAEAVNFALDSWLPMGKIAKRCQCAQAQDSVWVDVYEIERKLRGEETEYEETEDEEGDEDEDEDETGLPTPPSSHIVRIKTLGRKRKRTASDKGDQKIKKIRIRPRARAEPPCCLCPNDIPGAEILATDDGRRAHRMCALYVPETYIEATGDKEVVVNVAGITKARLELKCLYCRSKKGACFQCSQKKCARSYHATCAAAAGVFVEEADVPVFGEDGTEYKEQAFEFSCRFHRLKRDKRCDGDALENDTRIRAAAAALEKGTVCQMQLYRGDIFAGVVAENRHDEQTLLLDVVPGGDRVEIEWKWLLLPDPSEYRLPKASANALPMPTNRKAKDELNARRLVDELPRKDDTFVDGFTWAEFQAGDAPKNSAQVKVDLANENQVWFYLGKTSTESKAQYTDNVVHPSHNPKSNFLDSIPKPVPPVAMAPPPQPRRAHTAFHPSQLPAQPHPGIKAEKPYVYKPRKPVEPVYGQVQFTAHKFAPKSSTPAALQASLPRPSMLQGPNPIPQRQLAPQHGRPHPPASAAATRVNDIPPSVSFALDRFAPVGGSNGFPQLPGLTRPPAHMKSGHPSQPLPRAWSSSSSAAYPTPMTSSVLKSPDPPRPVSTYQKYSFFQVHHNRDSTRYRSPYAACGGFTNGYEGNFRAFMVKAQQSLSGKRPGIDPAVPSHHQGPPQHSDEARYSFAHGGRPQGPQPSRLSDDRFSNVAAGLASARQTDNYLRTLHTHAPLHPAIKPQYSATWRQNWEPADSGPGSQQTAQPRPPDPSPLSALPGPRMAPQFAPPPRAVPNAKQSHSPIPLPPYVQKLQTPPVTNIFVPPPLNPSPGFASTASPSGSSEGATGQQVARPSSLQTPLATLPEHQRQQQSSRSHDINRGHPDHREVMPSVSAGAQSASPAFSMQRPPFNDGRDSQTYLRDGEHQGIPAPVVSSGPNELPEVPTDSTTLLEQMMANLKRASERDSRVSRGIEGVL